MIACKELQDYGIIKVMYHGMPKKRYFKFDMKVLDKLYKDFSDNLCASKEADNLGSSNEDVGESNSSSITSKLDTGVSCQSWSILDKMDRNFGGFSF